MAGDDDSLTYAITTSAAVKSKLALSGEAVVILKSFDDLRNDLPLGGELSAAELESFVNANSVPLVQVSVFKFVYTCARSISLCVVTNNMQTTVLCLLNDVYIYRCIFTSAIEIFSINYHLSTSPFLL